MKIPETDNALVLRTDFSNERAWEEIREAIEAPVDELFQANVEFVRSRFREHQRRRGDLSHGALVTVVFLHRR